MVVDRQNPAKRMPSWRFTVRDWEWSI